jgi:hypothetical protein
VTSPVRVGHSSRADLGQLRQCREGRTAGISVGRRKKKQLLPKYRRCRALAETPRIFQAIGPKLSSGMIDRSDRSRPCRHGAPYEHRCEKDIDVVEKGSA